MDKKTKTKAIELLVAKKGDPSLTYADIERETGYSRRQLIRISKQIDERGAEGAAEHGNRGRKPATTATEDEVRCLREFKKPYKSITIAQFRDIFIEDVIENPDKRDDVERYGLVARSKSWFRELFRREGWKSPAQKPERAHGGRVAHPVRDPMPRRGMLVRVDGTPYDWFGDGDARRLRLLVGVPYQADSRLAGRHDLLRDGPVLDGGRKRRTLRPGRGRQGQPVHRRLDGGDVRGALLEALPLRALWGAGAQEGRARRQPKGAAKPVEEDARMMPLQIRGGDNFKKL